MFQLTEKDGTATYRRALRHHLSKCRAVKTPLHKQLVVEGAALYELLKEKARAHEDREDDSAGAGADAEWSELAFEDAVRDLDADLTKLDRSDASLGARAAIFPDGFGAIIEPDDEAQLDVLPALHVRISPFKSHPDLNKSLIKLDDCEADFKQRIEDCKVAQDEEDKAFAEEIEVRRLIRAQFNSANGRLRDFYKTQPKKAELFFLRTGSRRAKKDGGTPQGAAGRRDAAGRRPGDGGWDAMSYAPAGSAWHQHRRASRGLLARIPERDPAPVRALARRSSPSPRA